MTGPFCLVQANSELTLWSRLAVNSQGLSCLSIPKGLDYIVGQQFFTWSKYSISMKNSTQWPGAHCVANTDGADTHEGLRRANLCPPPFSELGVCYLLLCTPGKLTYQLQRFS